MNVSIGDRVIYRKYGGTELEWNNGDYLLIKEDDLQAKVL
jgi:chaperonin GroES